ncbi:hypothetical protein GMORB2_4579 [Geosmithia morbida]|uniref:Uncharacterized protein n=1 Tax=Geosmithia morbida TaxID=1094350 RepID=A0A9P4YN67_9HYPO|nr:uncharacterized protein GMORB2_4579 [Geosmithia morbida]KAF4119670.1 hypothetical protein GMORB2_4579 [Geosmithia morbida]
MTGTDLQPGGAHRLDLGRDDGTHQQRHDIPLFTDLASRRWDLDGLDPPQSVRHASVFYMKPDVERSVDKPYFLNIPVDDSWMPMVKQTNVVYTRRQIAVTDIRGHESHFRLDTHGFQLAPLMTSLPYDDFSATDAIVSRYYGEVREFLMRELGASQVLPFDFQVRRRDSRLPPGSRGTPGKAQPFTAVHGDQTANAAFRRLKYFHPEYAKRYATARFQIVNVWKPLRGPVIDSPLAVCDYRTVSPDQDAVPTDIVFPDYLGESINFRPNPAHRFYYIDRQRSDEAWMIKCFDSSTASNPEISQCT